MFIQMPPGDLFCSQWEYKDYLVIVEGELLEANLIPFKLVEFDVILRMDWVSKHHAYVGYREKFMAFN